MRTSPEEKIVNLIRGLKSNLSWMDEIGVIELIQNELVSIGKAASVRDIAKLISKNKTWVGATFVIIKGMKRYPEVAQMKSRHQAYLYILSKGENESKEFAKMLKEANEQRYKQEQAQEKEIDDYE